MKLRAAGCKRARLNLLLLILSLCCRSKGIMHSNIAILRRLVLSLCGDRLRLGSLLCVICSKTRTWLSWRRLEPRRREIGYDLRHVISWCGCVVHF